jgi:hypothetical protein
MRPPPWVGAVALHRPVRLERDDVHLNATVNAPQAALEHAAVLWQKREDSIFKSAERFDAVYRHTNGLGEEQQLAPLQIGPDINKRNHHAECELRLLIGKPQRSFVAWVSLPVDSARHAVQSPLIPSPRERDGRIRR